MCLHGALSLVETPLSCKACSIGQLAVYVNGTAESSVPCVGWHPPKSSDDGERMLTIVDEDFSVDVTRGPIEQSCICTCKVLKLKDGNDGSNTLVRPLVLTEQIGATGNKNAILRRLLI